MSDIIKPRIVEPGAALRWHKETIQLLKSIKLHVVAFWLPVLFVFFAFFFFIKAPIQEHMSSLAYSEDLMQIKNINYYVFNVIFDLVTTGIALIFWTFPLLVWHLACFHWAGCKHREFKEIKNYLIQILAFDTPTALRFNARIKLFLFLTFIIVLFSAITLFVSHFLSAAETQGRTLSDYRVEPFFIGSFFEVAYENIIILFILSVSSISGLTSFLDLIAVRLGLDTRIKGQGCKLQWEAEKKNDKVIGEIRRYANILFIAYITPVVFVPIDNMNTLIFSVIYLLAGCAAYIYWITYKTIMYRDIFEHRSGIEEKAAAYDLNMVAA